MEKPRVLIVGAGFGGLSAARALRRAPVVFTLLDRENHHCFQPLLYQVATAALSSQDIAAPTRSILRRERNGSVLLAEVLAVDLERRYVKLDAGEIGYDFLILAAGAETSYYGHGDWPRIAPGLKSLDDALEIRRRVLVAFELAEREGDPYRRRELLTFVVIGGGPTGVELAGALAELGMHVLARDFRSIDPRSARVYLLEGGPRLLPAFREDLSNKAREELQELGVRVFTKARVVGIDEHGVDLGDNGRICAATVLWAAGVRPSPLVEKLATPKDARGRVVVEKDLSLPGHPEAFAVGDMAAFVQDGQPLPGLSPVAKQGGRAAAEAILATLRGEPRRAFRYRDKGTMATVGRSRAIAQTGRLHLSGFIAWLAWLAVHIVYLIGFRNRVAVLLNWAWMYVTYRRGARVITGLHQLPPPLMPVVPHELASPTSGTERVSPALREEPRHG